MKSLNSGGVHSARVARDQVGQAGVLSGDDDRRVLCPQSGGAGGEPERGGGPAGVFLELVLDIRRVGAALVDVGVIPGVVDPAEVALVGLEGGHQRDRCRS